MNTVLTTKMSSKGQVVIPESMRTRFGWSVGTSFIVEVYNGSVIMQPIQPTPKAVFAERFDAVVKKCRAAARASGFTPADLKDEISACRAARRAKRG